MRIQVCLLGPLESPFSMYSKLYETCSITLEICWIHLMAKDLKYGSYEANYPHISNFNHLLWTV